MAVDISQRIKNSFYGFSKGQKKIATAVLNNYDKVAYMTAKSLGEMVGVSESTVVRFSIELGYEGYSDFQHAVQDLVHSKLTLNQRIEVTKQRIGTADVLESVMEADIARIRYTLESVDREAFRNAVNAILNARTIYVIAARSSLALAYFMQYNLGLIFDNVRFIQPTSTGEVFEQLLSISDQDVAIAFSFPRYSTKMIRALNFARQQKTSTIVITDSDASPLAEHASYLLTANSDMVSFTDSLVASFSIINAMIVEIANRRQNEIADRFNRIEALWSENNVYAKR